ncbi:MAG: sodium/glutamate symporter [Gammaproteobacteria bacterium]|nr:sodium/glutamate symporter [Gammaproteobacteria bacterium]
MLELRLDLLQTLSLAAVVYYLGIKLRQRLGLLDRLNIPSAVVGGLGFAAVAFICRDRWLNLTLDTSAQAVLNVAFFTTIGMGASLALLRRGGRAVVVFLVFAVATCFIQNGVGVGIASALGQSPLLGVMAGSVTMVGGPGTGMAFAPLFEAAGLNGAAVIAITAAVFGIVAGGLAGNPLGTALIRRYHLLTRQRDMHGELREELAFPAAHPARGFMVEIEREDTLVIRNFAVLAVAMGIGSLLGHWIQKTGLTLPAYIGAMIFASLLRNLDEATGWLGIDEQAMEFLGGVALNIFLVVALMDLRIWELAGQTLPLLAILLAQVALVALLAWFGTFRLMGRDYDSAVMSSGFVGFALGTTANAVVNMQALIIRYGPSPRAFLVVPLVGAFFIDFINALIITLFVNWIG